jgi:hypothetical protein
MKQEKSKKLAHKGVNPEEKKASSGSTHVGQSTSLKKYQQIQQRMLQFL